MATQTFTFLFAGIEGATAMWRRLGDPYAGVLADHRRLLRAPAGLLCDALPEGAWLEDLGLNRLTDGGRAEQIFQLQAEGLPTGFPPLRLLDTRCC